MITAGPAVDIPDASITAFVLERAERYGDALALIDAAGGRAYTFAEFATAVRRAATGLALRGFGPGEVLAVLAPNVPEYPIIFHAAALAGGTVVVLNPLDTADDLAARLNEAGARVLVAGPEEVAKATELAGRTQVRQLFVIGEADGATPISALLVDGAPPEPPVDPVQDVVALIHSSGSTGSPKGVMLTHRNMIAKGLLTSLVAPTAAGEKALAMPPFHHAFGLTMMMNASLISGTTMVTMPRFFPEDFLRAIQEHRITRLYIVPTIAVLLARSPLVDRYDLSSLKSIVSGGAALDPQIAELVRRRIGCGIAQGYGMTESMVSFMQAETPVKPASVGLPTPGVSAKVVDLETGEELGPHLNGEILIRGPQVMKGYLNAEEATAQALTPDGYLRTGDLGYLDEDGELFIVDRLKELIKYNGQQVSPVELEAVLMTHPKIADAAVVGVPDEDAGEVPKGFVVTREPTTAEEIISFVAERVAPYKKIRRIEFVELIPRTPIGKIERRTLKELAHNAR